MIETVQGLRAMAALLVVLFHASVVLALPKYGGEAPFGGAFHPGDAGVYLFFVLSGFIIAHAHAGEVGRPARLGRYAWNRATRIYPVYWLVALAALGLERSVLGSLPARYAEPAFATGAVTLLPFDGAEGNLAVAWTLFHEVVFYIVFAALVVAPKTGLALMASWMAACAASGWLGPTGSRGLDVILSPLNLLFGLGLLAWRVHRHAPPRRPGLVLALGTALFVALWAWDAAAPVPHRSVGTILLYGVASALMLIGAVVSEARHGWRMPPAAMALGAASYAIYLVHFLVLSAGAKAAQLVPSLPVALVFAGISAAGVAAGLLLHRLVERPLLAAARRLVSRRGLPGSPATAA